MPHASAPATSSHLDWVDSTRSLAALAVVALHVAASAVTDETLIGTGDWWVANLVDSATRWCVPVFVMLSGALLLAPGRTDESWGRYYRHRFARMLAPLLFWTVFYLGYELYGMHAREEALRWGYLLKQTALGMPYFHLWYLYMLPGLYLLTPPLRRLLSILAPKHLLALCSGMLLLAMLNKVFSLALSSPPAFAGVLFIPYLGYFLAGHLLSRSPGLIRRPWLLLSGSITVTALGCAWFALRGKLQWGTYFYDYFSLTTIPMGLAAFSLCLRLRGNLLARKIAPLSFGIYLVHPLILDVLWQENIRPDTLPMTLCIPLLTAFAFLASGLVSWLFLQIPFLRRAV